MILTAIYYPYSTDDGGSNDGHTVTIHDLTRSTHYVTLVPAMQHYGINIKWPGRETKNKSDCH